MANAAAVATELLLPVGTGSLSSTDVSRFSGVGGFALRATSAVGSASLPSGSGSVVGDSVANDVGEASSDDGSSSDDVAAPMAKAFKMDNGNDAEKKVKATSEAATDDDLCDQAEEHLDFFKSIIDFGDDKEMWSDQENEMTELMKLINKAVPVARKKSLVHMAKKLGDFSTKLKGAITVWQKAKQYKGKKGNDASSSALHMAVGLAKDKYPMVIR